VFTHFSGDCLCLFLLDRFFHPGLSFERLPRDAALSCTSLLIGILLLLGHLLAVHKKIILRLSHKDRLMCSQVVQSLAQSLLDLFSNLRRLLNLEILSLLGSRQFLGEQHGKFILGHQFVLLLEVGDSSQVRALVQLRLNVFGNLAHRCFSQGGVLNNEHDRYLLSEGQRD
jgi:hypothetical protein